MKTNIYFYLGDEQMLSTHDTTHIPFKKGDKIYFSVKELYPATITKLKEKYKSSFVDSMVEHVEKKSKKYHAFRFKIISVYKEIEEDGNFEDDVKITIEYKCKPCPKIYWKWWYFKSLIKKLFTKK